MLGQAPIKISLEGWWSPIFEGVLKTLHTVDHPVVNWSPYDHDRVAEPFVKGHASKNLTGHDYEIGPPLQRYMYQLARPAVSSGNEVPSIYLYYNLHGLHQIYYQLEKNHFNQEQQKIYETAAEKLLSEPDVIIYGFQPNIAQGALASLSSQYEWLYDGDNTDIPVFKVNFGDAFCNITAALHEIIGLIHHHYHIV